MPKWWFASTKYVIWPGSHCNCTCKPACTIPCAFVYSSRLPAYTSVHCGCPAQELIAHSCSLPQWIVQSFLVKPAYISASSYCLTPLSQEQMDIIIHLRYPKFRTWASKALFKVYLAERFENFPAIVFSQQKICLLRKLKLLWKFFFHFLSVVGRICQAGFTFSEVLKRHFRIQNFQLVFLETLVFPWNLAIFNYGKVSLFCPFVVVAVCFSLQFWVSTYFLHFSFPVFLIKTWVFPFQWYFIIFSC